MEIPPKFSFPSREEIAACVEAFFLGIATMAVAVQNGFALQGSKIKLHIELARAQTALESERAKNTELRNALATERSDKHDAQRRARRLEIEAASNLPNPRTP